MTSTSLYLRFRTWAGLSYGRPIFAPAFKRKRMSAGHLPQCSSASRFTAGASKFFILSPIGRAAGTVGRVLALRDDAFEAKLAVRKSRHHSTKANNGIPIETTFSSVSGALMEQLIFEDAALSSCPMNCTDFFRNLISIRTAILHYLNNYRTIAATDAKASAQELWRALNLWRARKLLRHASGRNCNQKASGESIEGHELHS